MVARSVPVGVGRTPRLTFCWLSLMDLILAEKAAALVPMMLVT